MNAADLDSLIALTRGELGPWRGVDPTWTRARVDRSLDPAGVPANTSTPYTGPLGYAATEGAPYGLTLEYDEGRVVQVTVVSPRLVASAHQALGEPVMELASELEDATVQWCWPRLGLACHVARDGSGIARLYGFIPMSPADFRAHPLSRATVLRHPTRERT